MGVVTLLQTIDIAAPDVQLPDSPWATLDVGNIPTAEDGTDPRYVLHQLLEAGSRMLLAGDEGIGKSLLIAQFAVRLAAGLSCLPGDTPPGRLRVLVVDTELNERTARRRLIPMAEHAGLQRGHLIYVLAPAGIDLLRPDEAQAFRALAGAYRPHLLVVDSLYRAFNGDPDDPRVGGEVQRILDTTRAELGCALLLGCHYRKRSNDGRAKRSLDDLAGSRVWKAWPETVVDVSHDKVRILKDREGNAGQLHVERTPAGEWERDPTGWPFTLTSADDAPASTWQGHTLIQAYALDVLTRTDEPLSTTRITSLIADDRLAQGHKAGFHRTNVAAALGELQKADRVRMTPGSRGANDWHITAAGRDYLISTSTEAP